MDSVLLRVTVSVSLLASLPSPSVVSHNSRTVSLFFSYHLVLFATERHKMDMRLFLHGFYYINAQTSVLVKMRS